MSEKSLGSFGQFLRGKGIPKGHIASKGDFPCIRYAEIYTIYGDVAYEFVSRVSKENAKKSVVVQQGDILFPASGETAEAIGKAVAYLGSRAAYAGGDTLIFREHNQNPAYLAYALNAWQAARQKFRLANGNSVVHLYASALRNVKIWLPPLAEQGWIAEVLSDADAAIAKTENKLKFMLHQLNGVRKSLISNSGKKIKLGELCQPKQWKTITKEELTSSGYPVFGANAYIGFYHTYNHKAETIAVSCRGSCGEVSMIPGPSYITGNSMCLDNIDSHRVLQDYLFHCLKVANLKKIISGSAQPQIILSDLEMFSIKIPDMSYQKKASAALGYCLSSIETQKNLIAALKKQKRGLMQQLLTGKIRVLPKNNKGGKK